MGVLRLDVYVLEEVLIHEVPVALVIRAVQADVLVKVEALGPGKGHFPRRAEPGELGVQAQRRGARGQAEYGLRLAAEQLHIALRRLLGYFLFAADYQFHIRPP